MSLVNKSVRIVLIGSGAVATHISIALKKAKHQIVQVYSPNIAHAQELAQVLNTQASNRVEDIIVDADFYLIAIKDDAIENLVTQITFQNGIWLHTAGSVSMDILKKITPNVGVFYPLQTFSKAKGVDFTHIPLCIEATNAHTFEKVNILAQSISQKVYPVNEKQRLFLHISAVFACNFVNFMYSNAQILLEKHQIPFDIIRPLILETAEKAMQHLPKEVQTGPAMRGDQNTLAKHQSHLQNDDFLRSIYITLSNHITDIYK